MAAIDITRNKVLSTISVPKGSHGLVVTPNGKVAGGSGKVRAIGC